MHVANFSQGATAPENVYSVTAQETAKHRAKFGWLPFSDVAAVTKPLKLAGVPQTTGAISGTSGPKFTILWEHVEEILLLKSQIPLR